jgi:two-component system nitrate/nitrite response regulator NarL
VQLVLCDDQRLYAESLAAALERRGHEALVTCAPVDAIAAVDQRAPDLCVFDLGFPDGQGLGAVSDLRRRHPCCPVAVLSDVVDRRDLAAAKSAGVAGILRKDLPLAALFDAFERIVAGQAVRAPRPARTIGTSSESIRVAGMLDHLTGRERQVLRNLVDARDTVEIARCLGVAPSTARTHLQNVLIKLGVHNRLQAVTLVVGSGMDTFL